MDVPSWSVIMYPWFMYTHAEVSADTARIIGSYWLTEA